MLAVIDNQFYDLSPLPAPQGDYTVRVTEDLVAEVYKGTKRLDFGVLFYTWSKTADIHPKTGRITLIEPKSFTFRAIIGDFHKDYDFTVEPDSGEQPDQLPDPDPVPA